MTNRLLYAYAVDNFFPLFSVCLFGDVVLVLFTAIFARYCSDRRYVTKIVGIGMLSFALVTIYAVLVLTGAIPQSKHQLGVVLGYIADIVSLALDISPFEKLRLVLASKSSESIPAILCAVIVANSVMWLLNGIIDNDLFIIIPNIVGIVLGSTQLCVWYIYRPGRYPVQSDDSSVEIVLNADGSTSDTSDTTKSTQFQPLSSPVISAKQ